MQKRHIVLIRHLKSDWADIEQPDFERPLAPRGKQAAELLRPWLNARIPAFDCVLSSPARRTRDTVSRLGLNAAPVSYIDALYNASAQTIWRVLQSAPQVPYLALVGHNYGLAQMASELVAKPPEHPKFAQYPTGATLIAALPANAPLTPGSATVVEFVVPNDLNTDTSG